MEVAVAGAVTTSSSSAAGEGEEVRDAGERGRRWRRGRGGAHGALLLRLLRRGCCCCCCSSSILLVVVAAVVSATAAGRASDAVLGARVSVVSASSGCPSSVPSAASATAAHRRRHDHEAVLERGELAGVVGLEDGLRFFLKTKEVEAEKVKGRRKKSRASR